LFTIGTITLLGLEILAIVVVDTKIGTKEPIFYFPHTLKEISINIMLAQIKVHYMKITKWNLPKEVQIYPLNLGIHEEPQLGKLNANLDSSMVNVTKQLLKDYNDVFAWMYKDLKGIPSHLMQHQIELDTNILASHQAQYQMNPNYVVVVKHDLDKLLVVGFIALIKETTSGFLALWW